jgi:hypothetical protein
MYDEIDHETLATFYPRQQLNNNILARLQDYELNRPRCGLHDEQIWTLLFAYGFVVVEHGRTKLANILIEDEVPASAFELWLEMLPLPPRQGRRGLAETNSNIDLVAGHQMIRTGTVAGIEYKKPDSGPGWICMTEVKWLHDIVGMTTHDFHRNQLARVIETALTFQQPGTQPFYPEAVHVTLLTPARFKPSAESSSGSRLYSYKFNEYWRDGIGPQVDALLADIDSAEVSRRRDEDGWRYPDLPNHIHSFRLHWVTFEQLLVGMPGSEYKQHLTEFLAQEPRQVLQL